MITNRPDWTLSRQRQWGTPMAFFVHKDSGELHPRTLELLEQVAQRVEQSGIEAWQDLDPRELLGDDAEHYVKNKDTIDVWFDSGTTHETVMRGSHAAESHFPEGCTSRIGPARVGSTRRVDVVHAEQRAALPIAADARVRCRWRAAR
jgi:isoleucyl-tRNA synthetase